MASLSAIPFMFRTAKHERTKMADQNRTYLTSPKVSTLKHADNEDETSAMEVTPKELRELTNSSASS